jgi:hypothetical protein
VLIVIVLSVIVDLQHTIGRGVVLGVNDHVDGRDDAVRGVEARQLEIVVLAYIIADRWLPGDEPTALRRARIGAFDRTDDSRLPTVSGFDEKVLLRGTVAAHLGERHAKAFGETRAASVRTFSKSLSRRAKLPKRAIAACWRRSLPNFAPSAFMRRLPGVVP